MCRRSLNSRLKCSDSAWSGSISSPNITRYSRCAVITQIYLRSTWALRSLRAATKSSTWFTNALAFARDHSNFSDFSEIASTIRASSLTPKRCRKTGSCSAWSANLGAWADSRSFKTLSKLEVWGKTSNIPWQLSVTPWAQWQDFRKWEWKRNLLVRSQWILQITWKNDSCPKIWLILRSKRPSWKSSRVW